MPTKNSRKMYDTNSYYHVYSRGINKQTVFHDDLDYRFFISLFKRYLSDKPALSKARVPYKWFGNRIELLAYCLMPNHVHMLIYQHDEKAMTDLFHSLFTSYSMYYNQKYKHYGPVFQSRYLASMIDKDSYLDHISRYIHLNPRSWKDYPYSSIGHYLENDRVEWLMPERVLGSFTNRNKYQEFLSDYEENKQILDELKLELAHE